MSVNQAISFFFTAFSSLLKTFNTNLFLKKSKDYELCHCFSYSQASENSKYNFLW